MVYNRMGYGTNMSVMSVLYNRPHAVAAVKGSDAYPKIDGVVRFYQTVYGVIVSAEVTGLPLPTEQCALPVFGFHIHDGSSCTGNESDPFADTMQHYNPDGCPHPHHSGDLPPLLGNNGYALQILLTDRFSINEIIGKTVIVHSKADDFTTQPSGNSGEKIACGIIKIL